MEGVVRNLFVCNLEGMREMKELELDLVGIEDDCNYGYTKIASLEDVRIMGPEYVKNGTRVRNWCQWTAVSSEDWQRVNNNSSTELLTKNRSSVNLVIEGIATFDQILRGTILRFEEVALQVEVNRLCLLESINAENSEKVTLFGLAGTVFRGGDVKIGERVVIV